MQGSGKTTVPSDATGAASTRGEFLVVHWIFPRSHVTVTPLGNGQAVRIGREPPCEVVLEGDEISRCHAEIARDGPLLTVRDLGSRNGSFLGGTHTSHAPVVEGDILRFGEWVGKVLSGSEAALDPSEFRFELLAPGLYGSRLLRRALSSLERVAASTLPLVIEGETGTGKEWTARAIHGFSRRDQNFLAVNCAALPESLAEAELFGHRKGAFTGADRASPGYFRAAQGGTLLLDEIIELSPPVQAKLLRVLEEHEVVPLGEASPVRIDVRVLAAAQQPLRVAVAERRFRSDLCARLDGLTFRLPPLRDRTEDVPSLLQQKLREHGRSDVVLDWRFVERLCLYDWPFNVREVDLLARQLVVAFPEERVLRVSHLPERIRGARGKVHDAPKPPAASTTKSAAPIQTATSVDRDEQDMLGLLAGLRRHHGNLARAAADAGISRQRAYRLMGARPDVQWPERARSREMAGGKGRDDG